MPNNYIIIGDVDSKEIERKKLIAAEETLKHINNVIHERKKGVFEVEKGFMPGVLTSVINPLFNKNAVDTKKFYADNNCTSCGICEKVCSCNNIKVEGKPQWGTQCAQCLACIHYCPSKAIQYGKATEKKGRYTNPNVSIG
jgi:ferredoxin